MALDRDVYPLPVRSTILPTLTWDERQLLDRAVKDAIHGRVRRWPYTPPPWLVWARRVIEGAGGGS